MRYYEILYIINPNFEQGKIDEIITEVGGKLEKTKSTIINHIIWGKNRLAYPIKNQKYGTYILLQFQDGNRDKINDFYTWMKLNTLVLRHMTIRLDNRPEVVEMIEDPVKDESILEMDDISTESTVKDDDIDPEQISEAPSSDESENEENK
ncbi:MAG TPA: 30S ribosomal protein S6 [Candidatus Marinimicrobia bacterium]|nr:30S ribosomal protein S6 [Candidatus Neomarinimicrobiota bacterium]